MTTWLIFLLAALAGAANPAQAGANAQLRKSLGQAIWATSFVYFSGLVLVLILQLFLRENLPYPKVGNVPWWAWLGGLISIFSTLSGLYFAQRLGSTVFTGLSVTASLVASLLLDHYGLIGFEVHQLSPLRVRADDHRFVAGGAILAFAEERLRTALIGTLSLECY